MKDQQIDNAAAARLTQILDPDWESIRIAQESFDDVVRAVLNDQDRQKIDWKHDGF